MRKRYLLFVLFTFIFGLGVCNAASISVRASASEVRVGSTFTVTVTVNGVGQSAGSVGAWKYCLDYNSTNLTLVSPSSPCVNDGVVGLKEATTTYTFKANTSASNTIGLSGVLAYDYESEQPIDVTRGTVTVRASIEEVSKQINDNSNLSSNNNLRVLEVVGYTLTPEFSKEKTDYTLEVPGDVESVQINAFLEDKSATITPIDVVNLTEGVNKFSVTVTAPNGKKKTYTITITRAESNPVKVDVDGKEYTVVVKEGALEIPAGYITSTVNISGKDVTAYKNEQAKITLVILKDSESNMSYYMYKDGDFIPYKQISSNSITLVPTKIKDTIKGYDKNKTITIAEKDITVFYKDDSDNIVLIHGINTITGEESWYYYDIKDGSMLKYTETSNTVEETKVASNSDKDYKLLTMIFVGLYGLALLLIIILICYVIRLRKKNEELFTYMEKRIVKHRDKKFNDIGDKDIEKSDLEEFDKTTEIAEEIIDEVVDVEDKFDDTEELKEVEEVEEDEKEDTFIDNTILLREDDIIDLDEDDFVEEPKKKAKEPTLISDTDILRNIAKANEESFQDEEPKKLTKKEEKMLKKKEKALAKKAQREFLNDEEFEESAFDIYERDETEVIPVVKKKPRTKGRKKS